MIECRRILCNLTKMVANHRLCLVLSSICWLLLFCCLLPANCFTTYQVSLPSATQHQYQHQHHALAFGCPSRQRQHFSVLQASKRRGGAMARRKTKESSQSDNVESSSSSKGFDTSTATTTSSSQIPTSKSDTIYSMPPLYDLAFGYRCYEEEVEFLLDAHEKYSTSSSSSESNVPLRILELAAGPARHSLAALSEHPPSIVDSVVALDRSQAMVDYGTENADLDLGATGGRRDSFKYVCGDMRDVSGLSSIDATFAYK